MSKSVEKMDQQFPRIQTPAQFRDENKFEHEIEVDGITYTYRHQQTLIVDRDGKRFKTIVETKLIGDTEFTVTTQKVDNMVIECGPTMEEKDRQYFLKAWEQNWKPSLKTTYFD